MACISGCGGSAGKAETLTPVDTFLAGTDTMPIGLRVINSNGVVQIDETFVNYVFKQKGVVAVDAYPGSPGTITITGNRPIIALRSTGVYVAVRQVAVSGSTYTYTLYGSGSGTVEWYAFDWQPPVLPAAGLAVFNAAGTLVFSSDYRPMRVVAAGAAASGNILAGANSSLAAPYTGTFAAILNTPRATAASAALPSNSRLVYFEGLLVGSASAVTAPAAVGEAVTGTTGQVVMQGTGGTLFLVDVSNL